MDPTQPTVAYSVGPEPKQRHMDKQRETRLCACKAHRAKTAEQASEQAGRQASHSLPKPGVETGGLRLKAWLPNGLKRDRVGC